MAEAGAPDDGAPVDQECVEGYLYTTAPAALLLLRRPPERGRIWVPVSGKVDPTDAGFVEALRREILEETGFGLVRPPASLDWTIRFAGPDGGRWRLRAYAVELDGRYPPVLSREHEAYRWGSFADAATQLHYPDNREAARRLLGRLRGDGTGTGPAPQGL